MSIIRNSSKLRSFFELFPCPNQISFCFGYGSAVFEQSLTIEPNKQEEKHSDQKQMIDLVLAVDNPTEWHEENLTINRYHYSGLRYLGGSAIAKIQSHFGGKLFYNTLVPVGQDVIKYGVISTTDLINDLLDWETLYLAGRLHKPTVVMHKNEKNIQLNKALQLNLQYAVHAALLLLPESFTKQQLYLAIASLSYTGDFRMTFGEDRKKIEKIVRPQLANFNQMYWPLLVSDLLKDLVHWCEKDDLFHQNCSSSAVQWHLNLLPKTVQHYLSKEWLRANVNHHTSSKSINHIETDDLMRRVAFDIEYRFYLKQAIESIVFKSSTQQTIKGFFTAGFSKSVLYSSKKLKKMFKSLS